MYYRCCSRTRCSDFPAIVAQRQKGTSCKHKRRGPVAPSAIRSEEKSVIRDSEGNFEEVDQVIPHALALDEIPPFIEEYRVAAEHGKEAGYDGVELHAANGYLPDQFLQDGSNHRHDEYGGSIENRARFMLEVVQALVSVWGENRVGVRISPSGRFGTMSDSDPSATFGYVAEQLNRFKLAYLHIIEPRIRGYEDLESGVAAVASKSLRSIFKGPIIAAGVSRGKLPRKFFRPVLPIWWLSEGFSLRTQICQSAFSATYH